MQKCQPSTSFSTRCPCSSETNFVRLARDEPSLNVEAVSFPGESATETVTVGHSPSSTVDRRSIARPPLLLAELCPSLYSAKSGPVHQGDALKRRRYSGSLLSRKRVSRRAASFRQTQET
jgi:hypothetical protein